MEEPGGLLLYGFVDNAPVISVDPFGLSLPDICCCGPNVTAWFARQLHRIRERVIDIALSSWTRYLGQSTGILEPFPAGESYVPLSARYREFIKSLTFEASAGLVDLTTDKCPSPGCENTVTLCDRCIDRTELGNIAFGYAGADSLAVILCGGMYAQITHGRGFSSSLEVRSTVLGYLLRQNLISTGMSLETDLCSLINRPNPLVSSLVLKQTIGQVSSLDWWWSLWPHRSSQVQPWEQMYGSISSQLGAILPRYGDPCKPLDSHNRWRGSGRMRGVPG